MSAKLVECMRIEPTQPALKALCAPSNPFPHPTLDVPTPARAPPSAELAPAALIVPHAPTAARLALRHMLHYASPSVVSEMMRRLIRLRRGYATTRRGRWRTLPGGSPPQPVTRLEACSRHHHRRQRWCPHVGRRVSPPLDSSCTRVDFPSRSLPDQNGPRLAIRIWFIKRTRRVEHLSHSFPTQ